ncbi:MAG TPA: hypothetical protein VFH45_05800 [Acidimicrobiales bacterium]|nr:hypothetical protein [Acidimicrobiales bacterium]
MRFRAGVVLGMAAGYYLGAMAGRERYEQMRRLLDRARRSEQLDLVGDKAKAVVDLGMERARDLVESKLGPVEGTTGNGRL